MARTEPKHVATCGCRSRSSSSAVAERRFSRVAAQRSRSYASMPRATDAALEVADNAVVRRARACGRNVRAFTFVLDGLLLAELRQVLALEHHSPAGRVVPGRWREFCHSAAPPSPF